MSNCSSHAPSSKPHWKETTGNHTHLKHNFSGLFLPITVWQDSVFPFFFKHEQPMPLLPATMKPYKFGTEMFDPSRKTTTKTKNQKPSPQTSKCRKGNVETCGDGGTETIFFFTGIIGDSMDSSEALDLQSESPTVTKKLHEVRKSFYLSRPHIPHP